MKTTRAVLITSLFILAFAATPALAATPVTVGQGEGPDIAVDPAGTAHIAWLNKTGSPESALYCQLPRGGAACVNGEIFGGTPSSVFGRAHVFQPSLGEVVVAFERCCGGVEEGNRAVRSTDGGLTFGAASVFGEFPAGASLDEAVYGPGSSVTGLAEVVTFGTKVQNGPVAGPKQAAVADLHSGTNDQGAIGLEADGSPVAVYQNNSGSPTLLQWRKLADGEALDPSTINDELNWTAAQTIAGERIEAADGPALAGGPNGLFLFWQQRQPDVGYVSKFTGTGWTPPVVISDGRPFNDHDLFQDAAGRLHAVWNAYSDDELRYRYSDDGINWSTPVDIHRGTDSYRGVRVAAAGDHQGFAVWDDGSSSNIDAVALEALPEPPDPTAPTITGFGISDPTLLPGQGASFSFISSEAGTAVLTFEKRVKGLKLKKKGKLRCLPRTKKRFRKLRRSLAKKFGGRKLARKLRKRGCRTYKRIGEIRQAVGPGANTINFNGRIAGRRLSKGRYRAKLVVIDVVGNVSRTETLTFRVIGKKKK